MSRYLDELKESVLRRMLPPENCSVTELSRETGITQAALYTWRWAEHLGWLGAVEDGRPGPLACMAR